MHKLIGVFGQQLRHDIETLAVERVELLARPLAKGGAQARRRDERSVVALERAEAEAQFRAAGLDRYFRGLLTEAEAGCPVTSEMMLEKAMRRLRSQKVDTVVFTGTLAGVEAAKAAGFRAVAVGGAAGEDERRKMRALADYELSHYEDWLRLE